MSESDDTYLLNDAVYLMEDFLKQTGGLGHRVSYEGEAPLRAARRTLLEW